MKELEALRKAAEPFAREYMCQHVHHAKKDQHDRLTPCPVIARLKAALKPAKTIKP